jgi:hypothetical protein
MARDRSQIQERNDIRHYYLGDDFPGRFVTADGKSEVNGRLVDVSRRGIGVVAKAELRYGTQVVLILGKRRIAFEVIYGASHLGIEGMYRVGMFSREVDCDLIAVFREAGLSDRLSDQPHSLYPMKISA